MEMPDIVIGTPSRIAQHLKDSNMSVKKTLKMIAIDEADLLMSFGFKEDVNYIIK